MDYSKELNIYERMSAIENELPQLGKDMTIGSGSNKYKAVGEAMVLNAVKPLEFKYRVKSLPIKREVVYQNCYETVLDSYTKRLFFIRIKTTFRFINLDNPSEFVDIESLGDGTDPLDKGSGKAQTYADKNALLKAYKMVSGEDTDNEHSNKYEESQKKDYKKYNKPTPVAPKSTKPVSTAHAKINEFQKDQIIKLVQGEYIDLAKVLAYYKVKATDELNFQQANAVISKGNKNKEVK